MLLVTPTTGLCLRLSLWPPISVHATVIYEAQALPAPQPQTQAHEHLRWDAPPLALQTTLRRFALLVAFFALLAQSELLEAHFQKLRNKAECTRTILLFKH